VKAIREAEAAVLRDPELGLSEEQEAPRAPVAVGTRVRVKALGLTGEVMSLQGGEAEVAVSGKRLRAPLAELVALEGAPRKKTATVATPAKTSAPGEINLVGLTVDEALPRVDKLLDDAALTERREVRVIHGFGEGRLRKAVADLLRGHPHVARYRAGGEGEGGGGVTVVELRD